MVKKRYFVSLGVGNILTFIFSEALLRINVFGAFNTLKELLIAVPYYFLHSLNIGFFGFLPVLVFSLFLGYIFFNKTNKLSFIAPISISIVFLYILPNVAEATKRKVEILLYSSIFGIVYILEATVLCKIIYLVIKKFNYIGEKQ